MSELPSKPVGSEKPELNSEVGHGSRSHRDWKRLPWLLFAFIVGTIVYDIILAVYPTWGFSPIVELLLVGSLLGQLCLAAILAGLWGRSWLGGYLVALGLSTLVMVSCVLTITVVQSYRYGWPFDYSEARNGCSGVLMLPLLTLAAAAPLLGMRALFGWQLERKSKHGLDTAQPNTTSLPPSRTSANSNRSGQLSGVSGLLVITAVAAGAVMTLQSAEMVFGRSASGMLTGALVVSAILAAANTFAVLPAAYCTFRIRSGSIRFAVLLAMVATTTLLSVVSVWVVNHPSLSFNTSGLAPGELWRYGLIVPLIGATYFVASLYCLRWSGYRLPQNPTVQKQEADPSFATSVHATTEDLKQDWLESSPDGDRLSSTATVDQDRNARRRHWFLVALTFAVLSIGPVLGSIAKYRSQKRMVELRALKQEWENVDAHFAIDYDTNEVTKVSLPRNVSLAWLDQLGELSSLRSMRLRDRTLSPRDLARIASYSTLRNLDLSHSNLSDEDLVHFSGLFQLQSLDVSDTQLTASGVERLLKNYSIRRLGIAGLHFDWQPVYHVLSTQPHYHLKIGGPDLTNQEVKLLLQKGSLIYGLDLTDSPIDESAFTGTIPPTLCELKLDGTKISDSAFAALLPSLPTYLSVANTQLTDAILPALAARWFERLDLSGTQITDSGLSQIRPGTWSSVKLSIPHLTGEFLSSWRGRMSTITELDLSHSSVDDEALETLQTEGSITSLNLAHTRVTHEGLNVFARKAAYCKVDVRGCKIDTGLLKGKNVNLHLYFEIGEYSESELRQLKNFCNPYPGYRLDFYPYPEF